MIETNGPALRAVIDPMLNNPNEEVVSMARHVLRQWAAQPAPPPSAISPD